MPFLVSGNSSAPPSRRLRQLSRAAERHARALQDLEPEGWEEDGLKTLRRAGREIENLAWDLEDLAGPALDAERAERRAARVREAVERGGGDPWDADGMAKNARLDDRTCAVDGCARRAVAACLCAAHRQRAARAAAAPDGCDSDGERSPARQPL